MARVLETGGGARFWAYLSPQNDTASCLTEWEVVFEHQGSNWTGRITSQNPEEILQTPGLSGMFNVTVTAAGRGFPSHQLQPMAGTQPGVIGCNANCAAMVGIVADPHCSDAEYWTVWDAFCDPSAPKS